MDFAKRHSFGGAGTAPLLATSHGGRVITKQRASPRAHPFAARSPGDGGRSGSFNASALPPNLALSPPMLGHGGHATPRSRTASGAGGASAGASRSRSRAASGAGSPHLSGGVTPELVRASPRRSSPIQWAGLFNFSVTDAKRGSPRIAGAGEPPLPPCTQRRESFERHEEMFRLDDEHPACPKAPHNTSAWLIHNQQGQARERSMSVEGSAALAGAGQLGSSPAGSALGILIAGARSGGGVRIGAEELMEQLSLGDDFDECGTMDGGSDLAPSSLAASVSLATTAQSPPSASTDGVSVSPSSGAGSPSS